MTDEELIAMARLAQRDERMSTGALYGDLADRIEALTEQLTAARDDAKEAEAYAEEVEADRKKTYEALLKVSRIHGEVEAKLARAEWLLTDAAVQLEDGKIKTRRNRAGLIWQFLEEIKGESNEAMP
jgi:hypothetical protein